MISIYSPLYVSDRGLLVFDQIPWFKVAERLEGEKAMMLEERKKFQDMLDQQQVCEGCRVCVCVSAHAWIVCLRECV